MDISSNKLSLIENIEDLILNIQVFNEQLDESKALISKLSYFTHWYYIERLDLFGPSKFIGYKGNTSDDYIEGTNRGSGYMSGIDTQQILLKLFDCTDSIDIKKYDELHNKLKTFIGNYDKKPNKRSKIYIV